MKLWAKTDEFKEGKFLVVRRDGTIPAWPHFVMGARDPHVPAALRAYADDYYRRNFEESPGNFDHEYHQSIVELAGDFEAYRAEHGDGDPEAGPHRTDDEVIVTAMRCPGGAVRLLKVTDKYDRAIYERITGDDGDIAAIEVNVEGEELDELKRAFSELKGAMKGEEIEAPEGEFARRHFCLTFASDYISELDGEHAHQEMETVIDGATAVYEFLFGGEDEASSPEQAEA